MLELVADSEIVVLALKPYVIKDAIQEVAEHIKDGQVWMSVAAGVSVTELQELLGSGVSVVRAMPNMPCTIQAGITAIYSSDNNVADLARQVFEVVGETVNLKNEDEINIATGLSGSGPAFFAYAISSFIDGAVAAGLDRETALKLASETAWGTIEFLRETEESPEDLVKRVATPGGTTEAGLNCLNDNGANKILSDTIQAATTRARQALSDKDN